MSVNGGENACKSLLESPAEKERRDKRRYHNDREQNNKYLLHVTSDARGYLSL
jgi:hypothetical protein